MPFPCDLNMLCYPSSLKSQNQFSICFIPHLSPFSLFHFPFLCLVFLQYWFDLNYSNNCIFLLFNFCSIDETSTYFFSIYYIQDFLYHEFLYHEFMNNLGKLELQVANWLLSFIYISYYLYSCKQPPKFSGKTALLFSRTRKKLYKIPWEI